MPRKSLVLAAALALAAGLANAQTPLAKLASTGKLSCQPALPVFCSNIHVSCAGPSTLRTFPFELRATRAEGWIESASDPDGMANRYAPASIEWHAAGDYVLLRPKEANGYVKLLADGSYSFRHYGKDSAVMSRGRCR